MKQKTSRGFTLIEVLIVVSIIGVLIAIAWPNFKTSREEVFLKLCISNMKEIEKAKSQYAMASSNLDGDLTWSDLREYIRDEPKCPKGGTYEGWSVNNPVCCTMHDWKTDPKLAGFEP